MQKLSRREALRGTGVAALAAGAAVVPFTGASGVGRDLSSLIDEHKRARRAFSKGIDQHQAFRERVLKAETIVPCFLGGGYALRQGHTFCKEQLEKAYSNQFERLTQLRRLAPDLAEQARLMFKAKQEENLALLDRMWEESGEPESDRALHAAMEAEDDAFAALCSYSCRNAEEQRVRAAYLLTTYMVRDTWEDEQTALLESLADGLEL